MTSPEEAIGKLAVDRLAELELDRISARKPKTRESNPRFLSEIAYHDPTEWQSASRDFLAEYDSPDGASPPSCIATDHGPRVKGLMRTKLLGVFHHECPSSKPSDSKRLTSGSPSPDGDDNTSYAGPAIPLEPSSPSPLCSSNHEIDNYTTTQTTGSDDDEDSFLIINKPDPTPRSIIINAAAAAGASNNKRPHHHSAAALPSHSSSCSSSRSRTTPQWACPFAIHDIEAHGLCLGYDFPTDDDLMRHLLDFHRPCTKSPDYPRCRVKRKFLSDYTYTIAPADEPPVIKGLEEGTVDQLKTLVSGWDWDWDRNRNRNPDTTVTVTGGLSQEEKFAAVWKLLFPGEELFPPRDQ